MELLILYAREVPYGLAVDIDLSGRADPGEEWGAHLVRYPLAPSLNRYQVLGILHPPPYHQTR